MTNTLVQVELAHGTGLAEDTIVNTFVLAAGPAASGAKATAVVAAFKAFYDTAPDVGLVALGAWLSPSITRTALAHRIKLYDLTGHEDGSNMGSPFVDTPFTLPAPTGNVTTGLPEEVALVATLYAAGYDSAEESVPGGAPGPAGDTRPQSRRRGRSFLGPFHVNATENVSGRTRPKDELRTTIWKAFEDLQTALLTADTGCQLGVWSRADAAVRNAEKLGVDNAWDTMRSRGPKATVRTINTLPN